MEFYGSQKMIDSIQSILGEIANEQGYDFVSPKFIKDLLEDEIALPPQLLLQ